MDLRSEFEQILVTYGTEVLIVRADTKVRCSCWNEKMQQSDRNCPICFGISWNPIVEKHTIRHMETGVRNSLAMIGQDGSLGQMNAPGRQYYMKHDAQVEVQSLIVEVDWSPTGKPIYNGGGIYQISLVDKKYFENGQVAYKKIFCKDQPIEKQIRGIRIANVNGIKNYELIGR